MIKKLGRTQVATGSRIAHRARLGCRPVDKGFPTPENLVLQEILAKKRILLNDDQRRRLAVKGKILGRKLLEKLDTLVTPDTILRWHRQLVAKKWDYSDNRKKKPGRPPVIVPAR